VGNYVTDNPSHLGNYVTADTRVTLFGSISAVSQRFVHKSVHKYRGTTARHSPAGRPHRERSQRTRRIYRHAFTPGRSRSASAVRSIDDLGNPACADGTATLADREPKALVHGDGLDQLDRDVGAVTGHHHLGVPSGSVKPRTTAASQLATPRLPFLPLRQVRAP